MMEGPKIDTINWMIDIKEAFGSYAILDNIDFEDLPAILQFARVVSNYKKMKAILS